MRLFLAVAAILAFSTNAWALTVTYRYEGASLVADHPAQAETAGEPLTLPGYAGTMVIDEALLPGGTLRNASIAFSISYSNIPDETAGLVQFDVFPFPATAGSYISFMTDAGRRIVSWYGDFMDGPPDGFISPVFDNYFSGTMVNYRTATGGSWSIESPRPIALPAGLLLLITGVAALGLAGRHRRSGA